jgi:hypothetical protein
MQAVEQTLTRVVLDPRLRVPATAPTISTSTSTGTGTTTGQ